MALTSPEVTFIQTHQRIVTRAMKPYLAVVDQAYEAGYPINVTPPVASGTATVGSTLAVTVGTWIVAGTYTFQWLRNGVAIGGATSQTYLLVAGDSGKTVSCAVTATLAGKTTTGQLERDRRCLMPNEDLLETVVAAIMNCEAAGPIRRTAARVRGHECH